MALIKQANTAEIMRNAVVLDLGDLQRQGQAIIARAREQAARIIAEGEAERARLVAGAAEAGREDGLKAGMAEGSRVGQEAGRVAALEEHRAALTKLEAGWAAALDGFLENRRRLEAEARRDVLALAALIAERVVKRVVELDSAVVERQLADVLALVMRPTRLRVAVNPADRELAERALPGLKGRFANAADVELADDAAVARGGCVLRVAEPGGGEIDATIATQVERVVAALLPGAPRTGAEGAA